MIATIPWVLMAVLLCAACPPLVHLLAAGLQRIVWALRAHADATGEYADAYRRHYNRRARPLEVEP